ncbi:inter-alpha-trypsin inhibitor heavy chain H3-like [Aplochiton taeniatus]
MERLMIRISLLGLLLACGTTAPVKDDWDIYSFHINSTVNSRYATTVITSRVANRIDQPREIAFLVKIPKNAFISKFRMVIEGQVYDGTVKAKEEAQQQYTQAVSRGQSAGLVSSVGRTLEEFKTSVTVAALQKVTFELTYEELLKRRLGKYELLVHARPMQPVKDFKIDVSIHETAGINFLEVKGGLSTNTLANAITRTHTGNQAWVHFYPTEEQQMKCDDCGEQGMNGDLVIVYDVNRDNLMGDLKSSDGYFVHHFAPYNLPRIPKNVVFIIDRSGSMHGKKMQQTREALVRILEDLTEEDYFSLITFDSEVSFWRDNLLPATEENLRNAKTFAQQIQDLGATDINAAVLKGAGMLNRHVREGSASLLILLTDGDPTAGVTNQATIQVNVQEAIGNKFPLYCLGFGFDVNFEFLEKMALDNNGVARRIYAESDAALQLKGFYEEVATPLLTDVVMIYVGGSNLTQTNFSQYYNGSEIVVAGQITDNNVDTFTASVIALSKGKVVDFSGGRKLVGSTGDISDSHIRRVWAYLTVKQLLDKELQLSSDGKARVKKEILEMSLKYSFVTPHTSMVVTKPDGESSQVAHKPKEGEKERMPSGVRPGHRFLLVAETPALPLCYDVPGALRLQLLQDSGSDLHVNGELGSSANGGFQKIVIHKADQHVEIDTNGITLRDGQNVKSFHWRQDQLIPGSVTLILRDTEVDVSIGDTRMLILFYNLNGVGLLWPVLRQRPSGNNIQGILAVQRSYEEVKGSSPPKLKIQDKEVDVSMSSAVDYSIRTNPPVVCWLLPTQSALQRELSDFIVPQL